MATLYVDRYIRYRNGSKRKQASKLIFQNNLIEVGGLKKNLSTDKTYLLELKVFLEGCNFKV